MAVEAAGDLGEYPPRVGDLSGRDGGQSGHRLARDDGGRAARDGVVEKGMAVRAATRQGEE